MSPPLGPTARRWILVLTAGGTALLVVIVWLVLGWRRAPMPPQEQEEDGAGGQPAAATSSKREISVPVVSGTPHEQPRPQPPAPPVVLAPTPPQPAVGQPASSLEQHPRFARTVRMMVGQIMRSRDAGQATSSR
jgi:hypothetical protein